MDYSLQKKTQEGYQVNTISFYFYYAALKGHGLILIDCYFCRKNFFFCRYSNSCLLVKKLPSKDVSDVTSRHQKPLLVFLSLSFWPRSNKSQRYVQICPPRIRFCYNNEFRSVKSNVITPSRLPRKRERPLKPTRLLPARPCQRFNLRHKPRCQRPQKWRVPAVKDKLPNIINWSSSFLFLLFFIIAGKKCCSIETLFISMSRWGVFVMSVQSVVVSSFCLDVRIYSP